MSVLSHVNDWVAIAANWLSLVSLVASVYAAVAIGRVKREIIGKATLLGIVTALKQNKRAMSEMINDLERHEDLFLVELSNCEAHLRAITNSAKIASRRIKLLITQIEFYRREPGILTRAPKPKKQQAWALYATLNGLIEKLGHVSRANQIGG